LLINKYDFYFQPSSLFKMYSQSMQNNKDINNNNKINGW